jgi:deazaflavin-dependent oxidoreductase (nitroreductase family)
MAKRMVRGSKPRGCARLLLRAPVWLYRLRLGWVLGRRFLLIEHTGRRSGKPRFAVVEVVRYDRQADAYVVASGWGRGADWYRNVCATPEVRLTVGARRFDARAVPLPAAEAAREVCGYARAHPAAFAALARLLFGTSKIPCERVAERTPLVVFVKRADTVR